MPSSLKLPTGNYEQQSKGIPYCVFIIYQQKISKSRLVALCNIDNISILFYPEAKGYCLPVIKEGETGMVFHTTKYISSSWHSKEYI